MYKGYNANATLKTSSGLPGAWLTHIAGQASCVARPAPPVLPSSSSFIARKVSHVNNHTSSHHNRCTAVAVAYAFNPIVSQANILAPPLSTASISAISIPRLLNRAGSSLRSQNSPCLGCTLPRALPLCPPMLPYGSEVCAPAALEAGGVRGLLLLLLEALLLLLVPLFLPRGPCC